MRRAKIVCTLGPASREPAFIGHLIDEGMNVARINFSHGDPDEHRAVIAAVRAEAKKRDRPVAILQDLQGPKIRVGRFVNGSIELEPGAELTLTTRDVPGTQEIVSTTYKGLPGDVKPGDQLLLDDGLLSLEVIEKDETDVATRVLIGGTLKNNKGINLPGVKVSAPALTDKDRRDLALGMQIGVDFVALSFVRSPVDIDEAITLAVRPDGKRVPIIAKIEKPEAIECLEEIVDRADGIMVARGDLGVEMPPEKVPVIQKHVIRRSAEWRKPVITATQMLESMIENPRPTRAEASDVANAIFDGTDAVMLSGETANGLYPREAVAMMARIVVEAESNSRDFTQQRRRRENHSITVAEAICESVSHAAEDLRMGAIAVFTETGNTARMISKYRPKAAIYAFSQLLTVCNRMNLLWGVHPVRTAQARSAENMVTTAQRELLRNGSIKIGDVLAVVAGTQMASGSTNLMRLHVVTKEK